MQDLYLNRKPNNPIDPLKEPLKGTLIDPFKGTLGALLGGSGDLLSRYFIVISTITPFRVPF